MLNAVQSHRCRHVLTAMVVIGAGAGALVAMPSADASTNVVDVYASQSRSSQGPVSPLQTAVDNASPGDVIRVHSGTYAGAIRIQRSGTPGNPIVMEPAGDGQVSLVTDFAPPRCDASGPVQERTIRFANGAGYWTIQGFRIVGGIIASGRNVAAAAHWLGQEAASGDWHNRRSLPGRMTRDPAAAPDAPGALGRRLGLTLIPSDGISILNNDISQRGIHLAMARYGVIRGNDIHDTQCGSGPGIWAGTLSDGWEVNRNHIYRIAPSTWKHYMQEGIRISDMASYSTITDNVVEDLAGDGRAYNTDVDASWNVFAHNVAHNVNIGYNDQMSGWGNTWDHNVVDGYRSNGFQFRALDAPLTWPSLDSSTNGAIVTCNSTRGVGADIEAGAAMNSSFRDNDFVDVQLSTNLRRYWSTANNVWNGSGEAPPAHASVPPGFSAC